MPDTALGALLQTAQTTQVRLRVPRSCPEAAQAAQAPRAITAMPFHIKSRVRSAVGCGPGWRFREVPYFD